ncbi:unnamed protein product, partial [Thlaspi arvense]
MNSRKRCAACKYLRRRCLQDCIFSPYFPPNNPQKFEYIHKIYGASNVAKILQRSFYAIDSYNMKDQKQQILFTLRHNAESKILSMVALGLSLYYNLKFKKTENLIAKTNAEIALVQTTLPN